MATTNTFNVTSTTPPTSSTSGDVTEATYKWLIAWGIMLAVLVVLNKTRLGHVAIYYALWLVLIFLLVTQYKFIAGALAPLNTGIPKGSN